MKTAIIQPAFLTVVALLASEAAADGLNIPSIHVGVNDLVKGGCWTNINEVKVYAEDKLRLLNHDVRPEGEGEYTLMINAVGQRIELGYCDAIFDVEISKNLSIDGNNGRFVAFEVRYHLYNERNINIQILENLGTLLSR